MTSGNTLTSLTGASTRPELLVVLKDLKNSVIGNTWKKVEVTEDEGAVSTWLAHTPTSTPILCALPTDISHTDTHLPFLPSVHAAKLLPPVLRALRNLLVSTADLVWGHMWGVGAERRVVATGLVGMDLNEEHEAAGVAGAAGQGKGKGVAGKGEAWKGQASSALGLVFESSSLATSIPFSPSLLSTQPPDPAPAVSASCPAHRAALPPRSPRSVVTPCRLCEATADSSWIEPGPSALRLSSSTGETAPLPTSALSQAPQPPAGMPWVLNQLLDNISSSSSSVSGQTLGARKQNPKLLEAALDLLTALVKGQPTLAATVRAWSVGGNKEGEDVVMESVISIDDKERLALPGIVGDLVDLLSSGPTSARIAAASCLTNIIKADKGSRTSERVRSTVLNLQLLDVVVKLLRSEATEERVKLCFVLAALVSDDAHLQKSAAEQGCPALLVEMLRSLDEEEEKGEIGTDLASRSREAILIALASLAFAHEPTRSHLAETSPPFLPLLKTALSHPSYGVRAAACQLARALSRTVAILRTSLVDSGVGEEVVEVLKREVSAHRLREAGLDVPNQAEDLGDRAWTVEVAATATICNLITDFSPLKAALLQGGGIELMCELTHSNHEPLALNALWALKNLLFHANDAMKTQVMSVLGWDTLRLYLSPSTTLSLRTQAFELLQNVLADATTSELTRTLEASGETALLDLVQLAARKGDTTELRVPAITPSPTRSNSLLSEPSAISSNPTPAPAGRDKR
ncbi:hypothetical protein EHS25_001586 [Saitozyma podzolica]|uniref:Uncharacterized protein n=1 Tax=Saitozyma podzolica TaxID=1890683 RepID=A0A427YGP2_9TREE|nr:hypothetical protein EHS25_001586 [Saitozyma podzolica]